MSFCEASETFDKWAGVREDEKKATTFHVQEVLVKESFTGSASDEDVFDEWAEFRDDEPKDIGTQQPRDPQESSKPPKLETCTDGIRTGNIILVVGMEPGSGSEFMKDVENYASSCQRFKKKIEIRDGLIWRTVEFQLDFEAKAFIGDFIEVCLLTGGKPCIMHLTGRVGCPVASIIFDPS